MLHKNSNRFLTHRRPRSTHYPVVYLARLSAAIQRQWRIHTTQVIRFVYTGPNMVLPYIEPLIGRFARTKNAGTSQPATRADNSYQDPVRSLCFLRARFGTTCVWNPTASISWRMRSVNR